MSWLCKNCETENQDSEIKCEVCEHIAPVIEKFLSSLDSDSLAKLLEHGIEATSALTERDEFYEQVKIAIDTYKKLASKKVGTDSSESNPHPIEPKNDTIEPLVIHVNGLSFNMIQVQGGTFKMGAQNSDPKAPNYDPDAFPTESPVHSVTLSDYMIGETEVTQALWKEVMGDNPSRWKGDNLPVECVKWNDVTVFIQKLNKLTGKEFSLPTEAEWEYAARGGNKSQGYVFSGSNSINDIAWHSGNSANKTHEVKAKAPNELGLFDMSGNVWEWCQDQKGEYDSKAQTNPTGPSTGSSFICRGGCWSNKQKQCRVSYRIDNNPTRSNYKHGFRLVLR